MRYLVILWLALFSFTLTVEAGQKADLVVVEKSRRKLYLKSNGATIKTYRIALGGNPVGHKQRQGDKRTPEGTYFLSKRGSSNFYKAMKISYPSSTDRSKAAARGDNPGGDIMLHGSPNNMAGAGPMLKLVDWTDGCIAVSNQEMDEIWSLVNSGTKIVINP